MIGMGRGGVAQNSLIFVNAAAVGNVSTGEDDLMNFTLAVDEMSAEGSGLQLDAWGVLAANGNSKTLRIRVGGTQVFSLVTTDNDVSWFLEMYFLRITDSTQTIMVHSCVDGAMSIATFAGTEDLTDALIVKVTGDATATDDIIQQGMVVEHI